MKRIIYFVLIFYLIQGITLKADEPILVKTSMGLLPLNEIIEFGNNEDYQDILLRCLDEDNNIIIKHAIQTLGRYKATKATIKLLDIIDEHHNVEIIIESIRAIGNIGDEKALNKLFELAKSPDTQIRFESITAIAKIGSAKSIDMLNVLFDDNNPINRAHISRVSCLVGSETILPLLIKALSDKEDEVKIEAMNSLYWIKDASVVPSLINLLDDKNPVVRKVAAWVLGVIGDNRAIDPLISMLNDPDVVVRVISVNAFVNMLDKRYLPAIIKAYEQDSNYLVRLDAIKVMGESQDEHALDYLLEADDYGHPRIRVNLANALANYNNGNSIEKLLVLTKDKYAEVRLTAIKSLFIDIKYNKVDILLDLLKSEKDEECKLNIIHALGNFDDNLSLILLKQFLVNPDRLYRNEAIVALLSRKDIDDSIRVLLHDAFTNETDFNDKLLIARTAGKYGDKEAKQFIMNSLHDNKTSKYSIIWSIYHFIDADFVNALIDVYTSCNNRERSAILYALERDGSKKSIDFVFDQYIDKKSHVEVIEAAQGILIRSRDERYINLQIDKTLLELTRDEKLNIIRTFESINEPKAIPYLLKCLHDYSIIVRYQAVMALNKYSDKNVIVPLIQTFSDRSSLIREEAANTLRSYELTLDQKYEIEQLHNQESSSRVRTRMKSLFTTNTPVE